MLITAAEPETVPNAAAAVRLAIAERARGASRKDKAGSAAGADLDGRCRVR
jgi:hypothetical protein